MQALQVSLFGTPVVLSNDRNITHLLGARALDLLSYVLIRRDRPHSRERLAEALWPEEPGTDTRKALRQALWALRRALAEYSDQSIELLLVDSETIQLNANSRCWIDVATFEAAGDATRGVPGALLSPDSAQSLKEAYELYTGDLLEGCYQEWCILERERYQIMLIAMLDKLTDWALANRDPESASYYGHRLLAQDQARERTYRQLMLASYLSGDRVGALRQYNRCMQILREEINVSPSDSTTILLERIRTGDPDLLVTALSGTWTTIAGASNDEHQLQATVFQLTDLHQRVRQIESELLQQIKTLRGMVRH